VDFIPEGDEIPAGAAPLATRPPAPIDSREAVIATGALAVITVVSVDQYGQAGISTLLSNELRRAMTQKADAALLSQAADQPGDHTAARLAETTSRGPTPVRRADCTLRPAAARA
jgi:hypothetical protein